MTGVCVLNNNNNNNSEVLLGANIHRSDAPLASQEREESENYEQQCVTNYDNKQKLVNHRVGLPKKMKTELDL